MSEPLRRRVVAGAPVVPADNTLDVVLNVIDRLRGTLSEETGQLRAQSLSGLHEFSLRKSQCLLELTRIAPNVPVDLTNAPLLQVLTGLCRELEENRRLLRLQLDAASEVAEIISRVIQDDLSDGTYSAGRYRG